MKKLFILLLLISSFCFGQKEKKISGLYSVKLISVDTNFKKDIIDEDLLKYEDSLISIIWEYDLSSLGFEIENKGENSIKINWNDAAIISYDGSTSKIFHKGVKYINREEEQQPTVIYKNSKLKDLLIPIDNVYFLSGKYGGWKTKPLIKAKVKGLSMYLIYDPEIDGKIIKAVLVKNTVIIG